MSRGFYLVVEGADGCGKTTQYNLLANALDKDFDVLRIREPGGTVFGDKVRSLLLDPEHEDLSALTELFLFSASRHHSIKNIIVPALRDGRVVLSDRNCYSTEAYQGAGGAVDVSAIRYCNGLATEGVVPNLAIILDVDVRVGLDRARSVSSKKDKIEARTLDYHERVRDAYRGIAKRDNDVCVLVDASGEIGDVHKRVCGIVRGKMREVLKV